MISILLPFFIGMVAMLLFMYVSVKIMFAVIRFIKYG